MLNFKKKSSVLSTLLLCLFLLPHFISASPSTCVPQTPKTCPLSTGDFNLLFKVADLNGDGKDDVIIRPDTSSTSDPDNTQILVSNGQTTWRRYLWDALNGENTILTVGDFNGDGKDDILRREMTPASGKNTAEVWFDQGSGEFTIVAVPAGDELRADLTDVLTGDFNGDGKTDFIRQEKSYWDDDMVNTAHVYLSLGTGTFTIVGLPETVDSRARLPGDYTNLIVGDFNGDGMDDFIRQKKSSNDNPNVPTAVLFISEGDGTFKLKNLPENLNIRGDIANLVTGDFNGDCKDDFIRQSICKPVPQVQASWTNWNTFTKQTVAGTPGTASGNLMVNGASIAVSYTGSVNSGSRTDDSWSSDFLTYASTTYPNGPKTGDQVGLAGIQSEFSGGKSVAQKITFSKPVTNPRLAIWSAGTPDFAVKYDFGTTPVSIIKTGPNYYTTRTVTLTKLSGTNIIEGKEGNGIIELTGTFTEINFKIIGYEDWHAVTVGIAPTVMAPCSDPSTLNLGSDTGDFTSTNIPASYNIEGLYSRLFVGDFNCDGVDDFIKQENGDRPSSTESGITVFLSDMTPTSGASPLFTKKAQEQVFEDASALFPGADETTPIYLGDFNGDGRDDYIQHFGNSCFTVIHALSEGKCVNKANQCKTVATL